MALHVGVIGEGVCSRAAARAAEQVGAAIGRAGALLVCGGRTGVMEAASRGAARAGGVVVGILPGFSRKDANRWVTIPIVTGMDQARNVVLVRSCDAVIAVGGSYGTLVGDRARAEARRPGGRAAHLEARAARRPPRAPPARAHAGGGRPPRAPRGAHAGDAQGPHLALVTTV